MTDTPTGPMAELPDDLRRIDAHLGTEYKPDWKKCDLQDFSKLRISEGLIHFRLYRQDGTMQPIQVADTPMNRLYVSWFQIHDRYTVPAALKAKESTHDR